MPSKYRKKSNARKNYYEKHVADLKENAQKYYQEHKETVQCRTTMKKSQIRLENIRMLL